MAKLKKKQLSWCTDTSCMDYDDFFDDNCGDQGKRVCDAKRAEQAAFIKKLKNIARKIPEGLGLFATESGLHVMQLNEEGGFIYTDNDGLDPDYVIANITSDCGSGEFG